MSNFSQKNWPSRQATLASWAVLACLVAGIGCGEMDEQTDSPVETQQQALEKSYHLADPDPDNPDPDNPDPDSPDVDRSALDRSALDKADPDKPDGDIQATWSWQWNLYASSSTHGQSVLVAWDAIEGKSYKLCWKKVSDSGTVCSNNEAEITAGENSYNFTGVESSGFEAECGGVEYKVRVKRSFMNYKTKYVTTNACYTANACPEGGWFDGNNCQIGQAPSGTNAFIYNGAYYYSYANGSTKCPLAGSHDDGANCFVQWIPSGVSPFIYHNHWYYEAYP